MRGQAKTEQVSWVNFRGDTGVLTGEAGEKHGQTVGRPWGRPWGDHGADRGADHGADRGQTMGVLTNHVQYGQCSQHSGELWEDFKQGRDKFGFEGSGGHMREESHGDRLQAWRPGRV